MLRYSAGMRMRSRMNCRLRNGATVAGSFQQQMITG
jgi:hypothetical protein